MPRRRHNLVIPDLPPRRRVEEYGHFRYYVTGRTTLPRSLFILHQRELRSGFVFVPEDDGPDAA